MPSVFGMYLLHPKSNGTVRINTTNPYDSPIVNPNYLAQEIDRKIWYEGLREVCKVANKMKEFGHQFFFLDKGENCKMCKSSDLGDIPDDCIECMTKYYACDEHAFRWNLQNGRWQ